MLLPLATNGVLQWTSSTYYILIKMCIKLYLEFSTQFITTIDIEFLTCVPIVWELKKIHTFINYKLRKY